MEDTKNLTLRGFKMRHNEAAVISLNEAAVMVGKGDSTVRLWLKNGVV